jgi:thiamine-phosphate pyrophosphorylase
MTTPQDTSAWAQQIAQHHAQLQIGQPLRTAEATLPSDAHLPQAQAAVLQGARMLGFIEADAQCVAQAWQHQAQRLGQFDPLHWPDQALDFQMPAWPRQNAFAPCPRALGLYAVLPNA